MKICNKYWNSGEREKAYDKHIQNKQKKVRTAVKYLFLTVFLQSIEWY